MQVVQINILGLMGLGKTNTAKYITRELVRDGYSYRYAIAPSVQQATAILTEPFQNKKMVIVFDDISFLFHAKTLEMNRFLNLVTKIRHVQSFDSLYLIYITHYSKSIAPFLRGGQVHILCSLTDSDLSNLSEFFHVDVLKGFMKEYVKYLGNPRERLVLAKTVRRAGSPYLMARIPLVEDFEFTEYVCEAPSDAPTWGEKEVFYTLPSNERVSERKLIFEFKNGIPKFGRNKEAKVGEILQMLKGRIMPLREFVTFLYDAGLTTPSTILQYMPLFRERGVVLSEERKELVFPQ
jgi:hypothetical protein